MYPTWPNSGQARDAAQTGVMTGERRSTRYAGHGQLQTAHFLRGR